MPHTRERALPETTGSFSNSSSVNASDKGGTRSKILIKESLLKCVELSSFIRGNIATLRLK